MKDRLIFGAAQIVDVRVALNAWKILSPRNDFDESSPQIRFLPGALRAAALKSVARPLNTDERTAQAPKFAGTLPTSVLELYHNSYALDRDIGADFPKIPVVSHPIRILSIPAAQLRLARSVRGRPDSISTSDDMSIDQRYNSSHMPESVTILGDGAMATVCSILLTQGGHAVTMWGAFEESIERLIQNREQSRLLPGVKDAGECPADRQ